MIYNKTKKKGADMYANCLDDLLKSTEYLTSKAILPIVLGLKDNGKPLVVDLSKMPHLLIYGNKNSNKKTWVNFAIKSINSKYKMSGLCDIKRIQNVKELENEYNLMESRYRALFNNNISNIRQYNEKIQPAMSYRIMVIENLESLIFENRKKADMYILRLAEKARAVGMHMLLCIDNVSSRVLSGTIKICFPVRMSFRAGSRADAIKFLGESGAEKLNNDTDFLFSDCGRLPVLIHIPSSKVGK